MTESQMLYGGCTATSFFAFEPGDEGFFSSELLLVVDSKEGKLLVKGLLAVEARRNNAGLLGIRPTMALISTHSLSSIRVHSVPGELAAWNAMGNRSNSLMLSSGTWLTILNR